MKHAKNAEIREIYPYIYRITLPLPGKKPGPVNVYLFIGDTITILDTGTLQTFPLLAKAIEKIGLDLSSLKQIVFSHGHIDHYGAAQSIISLHGGSLQTVAHADDVTSIEKGYEVPRRITYHFLRHMALPLRFRIAMAVMVGIFSSMSRPCRVTRKVADNEKIQMGNYSARVIHTPGHSRGSICFYIEKENILFAGDTVLPHITPNAFVMLDGERSLPQRASQAEFYASLEHLESLKPSLVFPAHGDIIDNLGTITAGYRASYNDRDRAILSILKSGEYTVYEIARILFRAELEKRGKRLILELYLAISEVYTHLQVLERRGLVHMDLRRGRTIVRKK